MVEVNITKTRFYVIMSIILLITGALFVNAYGTNNPPNYGHSSSEIGPGTFTPLSTTEELWTFPGRIRIDRTLTTGVFNIWLQGGDEAITSGHKRNLALLGTNDTHADQSYPEDTLWVNFDSEFQGGTRIGAPAGIACDFTTHNCHNISLIRWDKWVEGQCAGGVGVMECNDGWIQTMGGHWTSLSNNEFTTIRCTRVDPTFSTPAILYVIGSCSNSANSLDPYGP